MSPTYPWGEHFFGHDALFEYPVRDRAGAGGVNISALALEADAEMKVTMGGAAPRHLVTLLIELLRFQLSGWRAYWLIGSSAPRRKKRRLASGTGTGLV